MAFFLAITLESFSLRKGCPCVHRSASHTKVVTQTLLGDWPFQSSLLSSKLPRSWGKAPAGSFARTWSVGWGNPDFLPAALIEVEGPPSVFPRRVTDSRFSPSSPEVFLKTLPASPVGSISTSDPTLW